MTIKEDLEFWLASEEKTKESIKLLWLDIYKNTDKYSTFYFYIILNWIKFNIELKTRRFNKDKYSTTIIGANKLAEAYNLFYKYWEYSLFLFKFTDWLFYINPFQTFPEKFDYIKYRYDRGSLDAPKGWCLYNINKLTNVKENTI